MFKTGIFLIPIVIFIPIVISKNIRSISDKYPWIHKIKVRNWKGEIEKSCVGITITPYHVLTVAKCLLDTGCPILSATPVKFYWSRFPMRNET